ncbi:MAG: hypothetical protein AB199_02140 [Parcubacteria bacterium C7867-004]|nr:MAG: hypothetical protein AB199_02140 [Parcubacteria bacterium C7867-004]
MIDDTTMDPAGEEETPVVMPEGEEAAPEETGAEEAA